MRPEPSVIIGAFPLSSLTDWLARKPAADYVYGSQFLAGELCYIGIAVDVRPVLGQDALAVGIGFNLPANGMPRPFQAQVQTTDAREERADGHTRRYQFRPVVSSR